jgi:hypothetical protein
VEVAWFKHLVMLDEDTLIIDNVRMVDIETFKIMHSLGKEAFDICLTNENGIIAVSALSDGLFIIKASRSSGFKILKRMMNFKQIVSLGLAGKSTLCMIDVHKDF